MEKLRRCEKRQVHSNNQMMMLIPEERLLHLALCTASILAGMIWGTILGVAMVLKVKDTQTVS
jgi:uncharacterized membrane protein